MGRRRQKTELGFMSWHFLYPVCPFSQHAPAVASAGPRPLIPLSDDDDDEEDDGSGGTAADVMMM